MGLPKEFFRKLPERSEEELLQMLANPTEYSPAALEAARKELDRRKLLPDPTEMEVAAPQSRDEPYGSYLGEGLLTASIKSGTAILVALSLPILILNCFGGIGSGIWLVVLGEWRALIIGIVSLAVAGMVVGNSLIPSALLAMAGLRCAESGNRTGFYFFAFLSNLYNVAVVTGWCMGVFYFFGRMADERSAIPMLIWSYGVAMAPLSFLAQKDKQAGGESHASVIAVFFASIAYLVILVMALFGEPTPRQTSITFLIIMCGGMLLNFVLVLSLLGDEIKNLRTVDTDENPVP